MSLQVLANHGRTVIFTVHRPGPELFKLFDNVLLLNKGKVYTSNQDMCINLVTLSLCLTGIRRLRGRTYRGCEAAVYPRKVQKVFLAEFFIAISEKTFGLFKPRLHVLLIWIPIRVGSVM